jgi:hypothetical protein
MDLNEIESMLMSAYGNDKPVQDYVSTATTGINNLTRKRVRDLLSKFSTTGMGRSGISGAAMNDIYSNAGESISEVGARGEEITANNRSRIIGQLLGLAEYQDQKTNVGDVLGFLGGTLGGSILGPVGGAIGSKLGKLI